MNLLTTRLGLLAPTTTPVWTGTANGAQSEAFALAVTTVAGTLPTATSGLVLVRAGLDLVRLKSHSGSTLNLSENPVTFTAGDALAVYDLRLPWPRYQRLVSTTVYKDYDVPFPATWQHSLPPAAVVTPSAVWLEVGDTQLFDAGESQVMAPDPAGGLTATWDCTGWGTGTAYGSSGGVTDAFFPLTPTATGLHYLKCTLTDEWGGAAVRYVPVWVGTTPTAILGAALEWSLERGWRGSGALDGAVDWLAYSPVALVDLDTRAVLFYGFYRARSVQGDLGMATTEFELLSPLGAAADLYGYPFIVTDIADPGSAPPDTWAEVGKLTCARALWYLLVWHSLLPQLANLNLGDPTTRRIAGQAFSAGNLLALIGQVTQAAFYALRAAADGSLSLEVQPLYADAATWAALPTYSLPADERSAAYSLTPPQARCSEVRCSGVYLAVGGDYAPAIARCPAHPAAWGAGTNEVTKLAPLSAAELLAWAARHFAVENQATAVDVAIFADVDPATYARVVTDISGAATVALDSLRYTYDAAAVAWQGQLSGRTYDAAPGADYVPIPPVVVIPAPTPPPLLPPIDPLPPEETRMYVGTLLGGLYYTTPIPAPGEIPVWVAANSGLTSTALVSLAHDPLSGYLYGATADDDDPITLRIWRFDPATDTWALSLDTTAASLLVDSGPGGPHNPDPRYPPGIRQMAVDVTTGYVWLAFSDVRDIGSGDKWYLTWLYSTDNGVNWTMHDTKLQIYLIDDLVVQAPHIWFMAIRSSTGGAWTGRYHHSSDGGVDWDGYLSLGGYYALSPINIDPNVPDVAYGRLNVSGEVLYSVTPVAGSLLSTELITGIEPDAPHQMLFDTDDPLHQYLLFTSQLFETVDGWATLVEVAPPVLSPSVQMVRVYSGDFYLGKNTGLTSSDAHHVYGRVGTTLYGLAGANAGVYPYTDSIPYTAGGVCVRGIVFNG